jgi:hypothetical protein
MMAIYLMITFSPMASAALHSKSIVHAVTGECSGDCTICGCSPAARANHTCCCAKKKHQQNQIHDDDEDTPECCRKKQAQITIVRCGCPCGEKNPTALQGFTSFELLPVITAQLILPSTEVTGFSISPQLFLSHLTEPPDPPPQNNSIF